MPTRTATVTNLNEASRQDRRRAKTRSQLLQARQVAGTVTVRQSLEQTASGGDGPLIGAACHAAPRVLAEQ